MEKQLGPYQLLKRLGVGGTAEVFLASGPSPRGVDDLIALKVVLPHLSEDQGLKAMMVREARTASLLKHPNVVEIYDVGELPNSSAFLAMEFIPGASVRALEKKLKTAGERLEVGEACAIIHAAALGLHYAHEAKDANGEALGLIHRDVSPHNIIVAQDGRVKVVDFGLAKATNAQATQTGGLKGKLAYMPPEQIESKPLDRRTDVFALGAVLFELCTGRLLYPGGTEAEIIQQALNQPQPRADELDPDLPPGLVKVISQTVERNVELRTPTGERLAALLAPFVPKDADLRLARVMKRHFDPLPRTASQAVGLPATPEGTPPPRPKRTSSSSHTPAVSPPPRKRTGQVRVVLDPVPEPEVLPEDTAPKGRPLRQSGKFAKPNPRKLVRWLIGFAVVLGLVVYGGSRLIAPPPPEWTPPAPINEPLVDDPNAPNTAPRVKHQAAAKFGTLVIEADEQCNVRENGKQLGITTVTLTLSPGHHHFELDSVDKRDHAALDVEVVAGKEISRKVSVYRQ